MAKRGPKPTPSKVLQLRGSWRGHKKTPTQQTGPQTIRSLTPPQWLQLSPDAQEHWRQLGAVLKKHGLLTTLDLPAFAHLCETWAGYQRARQELLKQTMLSDDARGAMRPNPLLRILKMYSDTYAKLARQFFCTPAARDDFTQIAEAAQIANHHSKDSLFDD